MSETAFALASVISKNEQCFYLTKVMANFLNWRYTETWAIS